MVGGALWERSGEVPTQEQSLALSKEWVARGDIPTHVMDMLNSFPSTLHPMAQFSAAMTALHSESIFAAKYVALLMNGCRGHGCPSTMDGGADVSVVVCTLLHT